MANFPSDLSGSAASGAGGADHPDKPGARSGRSIKHAIKSLFRIDKKKLMEKASAFKAATSSSSKQAVVIGHGARKSPAHPLPGLTEHLNDHPVISAFIRSVLLNNDQPVLAVLEALGRQGEEVQRMALADAKDDPCALLAYALITHPSYPAQVLSAAKDMAGTMRLDFARSYIGTDDLRQLVVADFAASASQHGWPHKTQLQYFASWAQRLLAGAKTLGPREPAAYCEEIASYMLPSVEGAMERHVLTCLIVPTPPPPAPSLDVIPEDNVHLRAFFQQAIDREDTALVILLQDLQMLPKIERTVVLDAANDRQSLLLAHLLARTPGFRNRVLAGEITRGDCRAYAQDCFNASTIMGEDTAVMSTWCDNVAAELQLLALRREETQPTSMLPGSRCRAPTPRRERGSRG